MNVFLFEPQFEPLILAGSKDLTIRAPRKDGRPRAEMGDRISLRVWTGNPYRSKQREFAQATTKFVIPVCVGRLEIYRTDLLAEFDRRRIARADGFPHWLAMKRWFKRKHGLPFKGVLIHWHNLSPK